VSEPARIALRLLGVVLLGLGLAFIVIMFYPGPRDVADWMGNNCAHTKNGPAEQCTIWDVLDLLWISPVLILAGGLMALLLRPGGGTPMTIDLSGRRQ
jgi:hypothetical protein